MDYHIKEGHSKVDGMKENKEAMLILKNNVGMKRGTLLKLKECKDAAVQTDFQQSDIDALYSKIAHLESRNEELVARSREDRIARRRLRHKANYYQKKNAKPKKTKVLKKNEFLEEESESEDSINNIISEEVAESQEIISKEPMEDSIREETTEPREVTYKNLVTAVETVGNLLKQAEVTEDEFKLFSQCKELVMSKVKSQDFTDDSEEFAESQEATHEDPVLAMETLGKFLMQADINVDELMLFSQCKDIVVSKHK